MQNCDPFKQKSSDSERIGGMSISRSSLRWKSMNPTASRSGTTANEAGMDSPRIPIHTGFYIQIKNGKAVNPGGRDQEAIGRVELWTKNHPNNPHSHTVETWL